MNCLECINLLDYELRIEINGNRGIHDFNTNIHILYKCFICFVSLELV